MPANSGQDNAPGQTPDSITLETFSGLRNTVDPERLGPRELARAVNIDIDDAGQIHRRRGQTLAVVGAWHSLFQCSFDDLDYTFGVNAGALSFIRPDYTTAVLLDGLPQDHLSWACVGPVAYFANDKVSGQIDLRSGNVTPWGFRNSHSYFPQTSPVVGQNFWLSPVVDPNKNLPPVAGRLLGPVPFGKYITYHNGRIYIAVDNVLWATELYLYNFVDKTKGYRQFDGKITGICAVEDGIYVGTAKALWFVSGVFAENRILLRERSGVIPGTMIAVPGEVVHPASRERPDIPHVVTPAMACMTASGQVVGLNGGETYNLTRNSFKFPAAVSGKSVYREQDGFNTIVNVLESGGTPTTSDAAFGDYVAVTQIRNGVVIP